VVSAGAGAEHGRRGSRPHRLTSGSPAGRLDPPPLRRRRCIRQRARLRGNENAPRRRPRAPHLRRAGDASAGGGEGHDQRRSVPLTRTGVWRARRGRRAARACLTPESRSPAGNRLPVPNLPRFPRTPLERSGLVPGWGQERFGCGSLRCHGLANRFVAVRGGLRIVLLVMA
jgi:hypothetical protein